MEKELEPTKPSRMIKKTKKSTGAMVALGGSIAVYGENLTVPTGT